MIVVSNRLPVTIKKDVKTGEYTYKVRTRIRIRVFSVSCDGPVKLADDVLLDFLDLGSDDGIQHTFLFPYTPLSLSSSRHPNIPSSHLYLTLLPLPSSPPLSSTFRIV